MKNNTFEEISAVIAAAEKILLYPHIHMDGDALGSAAALCRALRNMGKTCFILLEDEIPANLAFLDKGYCTADQDVIREPDLSICVDCGDTGRFPQRREKFAAAPVSICIDHHSTTENFCDYNYVDGNAAATGELIYDLLVTMGCPVDREMAEALFAAITSDTGNFQYANTSKRTHQIVASLYDTGIDTAGVSFQLYESKRIEKLLIVNRALSNLTLIAGGRGAIAFVTREMLEETGARMDETDGIVAELRSIGTVEVSVLLKEMGPKDVKVSLRSKRVVDVAAIAQSLGGGGHVRAAGCSLNCSVTEAFDLMKEKLTACLGDL